MKRAIATALRALAASFTPVRIVVALLVAALFWFLILGDQGVSSLRQLLAMKHRLTADRQKLSGEIDALAREKANLSDPANLETIIRSELGYIKPGEVVFEEKKQDSGLSIQH
jgi:cell division protein FtsB